jgi:hypothetical protein
MYLIDDTIQMQQPLKEKHPRRRQAEHSWSMV